MRRCLVVANQTLAGAHLLDAARARLRSGPCEFHIVVPATPAHDHATWVEGEARGIALRRLRAGLERFREIGAEVDGEVGDHSPIEAIGDALREHGPFDEIILSTLPPGRSRWLKLDLPSRVRSAFGMPVTHVIGQLEPAAARSRP